MNLGNLKNTNYKVTAQILTWKQKSVVLFINGTQYAGPRHGRVQYAGLKQTGAQIGEEGRRVILNNLLDAVQL